jgi:regulator of telomere elongation helicase 1
LRKKKQCPFLFDDKIATESAHLLNACLDIEEFIDECRRKSYCPYMLAQITSKRTNLVLAPYTYIVDPVVRERLPIETFMNSVVIIDEAHNFPDQCSDRLSNDLPFHVVYLCLSVLRRLVPGQIRAQMHSENAIDAQKVGVACQAFEAWAHCLKTLEQTDRDFYELMLVPKQTDPQVILREPDFFFDMLTNCGINEHYVGQLSDLIDDIIEHSLVLELQQNETYALERVHYFLKTMYRHTQDRQASRQYLDDYFSLCLTNEPAISMICFTPAPGFTSICAYGPRTVILTSGTLSPIDSFAKELGQKFPIRLEGGHVADPSQIFVGIASRGTTNAGFQFTFANRKNEPMRRELAESLKSIYGAVPSGVLTFFPSFTFLEDFTPLLNRSSASLGKPLFVEPRDGNRLHDVLANFHRAAHRGAALLGVCRGRLSEGLDFADEAARCVCVVGIPFPNASDFRVTLKRQWLDRRGRGLGSRWYTESAMRAVNQAIGRAIRHRSDYAAIVLIDERFAGFQNMLSKWIRPSVRMVQHWSSMLDDLRVFFSNQARGVDRPLYEAQPLKPLEKKKPAKRPIVDCPVSRALFDGLTNGLREKARPDPLQLERSTTRKTRKANGAIMQLALEQLFSTSRTDSEEITEPTATTEPPRKLLTARPVDPTGRIAREVPKCAYCKQTEGRMQTMACGHCACVDCFGFREALGALACPICRP